MTFLYRRAVLGIIVIVVGGLFLANSVLGWEVPIWGIIWPIVLIGAGISIVLPQRRHSNGGSKQAGDIVFEDGRVAATSEQKEHTIMFGRGEIDLTHLKIEDVQSMEINVVFGTGRVLINENEPIKIRATSAFGNLKLPNETTAAFSDSEYETKAYRDTTQVLFLKINCVFSTVDVVSSNK